MPQFLKKEIETHFNLRPTTVNKNAIKQNLQHLLYYTHAVNTVARRLYNHHTLYLQYTRYYHEWVDTMHVFSSSLSQISLNFLMYQSFHLPSPKFHSVSSRFNIFPLYFHYFPKNNWILQITKTLIPIFILWKSFCLQCVPHWFQIFVI